MLLNLKLEPKYINSKLSYVVHGSSYVTNRQLQMLSAYTEALQDDLAHEVSAGCVV